MLAGADKPSSATSSSVDALIMDDVPAKELPPAHISPFNDTG
jgi:hypothetical protein